MTSLSPFHFRPYAIIFSLFVGLNLSGCNKSPPLPPSSSLFSQDILLKEILETIHSYYISKPEEERLKEGAMNGLLSSLDPYCTYLTPEAYEQLQQSSNGEFGGLGLEILFQDGFLKIITPLDGSPAAKANLMAGDYITFINKIPVNSLSYTALLKMLHGQPGSTINLTIQRGESASFSLSLNREIIHINPVKHSVHNNISIIRLSYFNEKTTEKLKETIDILKKESTPLKGVILDLRNNPGGLFNQAIEVANCFLSKGIIVSVLNKEPVSNKTYSASGPDLLDQIPLIVLINKGTASSAEIVAAALQDNKRALIIGQKSVGKGSIQSLIPLTNKGAVKLTTAIFHSPKGDPIKDRGVIPDILSVNKFSSEFSPNSSQDDQLNRAVDLLKGLSLLKGA